MMLIYVDLVTERLQYTFDFIFKSHGLSYRCINDQREFLSFPGTKLNYSSWDPGHGPNFEPSALLFEESIDPAIEVSKSEWEGVPLPALNGVKDPFAAVFYVISRYEEYVAVKTDAHGRFEATSSILYRFGWLDRQIVEVWVEAIVRKFCPEQLEELIAGRKVTVIPSFDIDNTFAFKWKSGWRKLLAIAKDLVKNNRLRIAERRKVNSGEVPDPYDSFAQIEAVSRSFPETRVFWLLADYSQYDRNISWHDPRHQRLIRSIGRIAKVGLHPGYQSNSSDRLLAEERERICKILGKKVAESRQHFLKLTLPVTYNRLIELGFERDFTMGYADHPGFRAGTARSFYFFDLKRNVATSYEIVPFVYMDGTFKDYLRLSPVESWLVICQLASEVKHYGGNFCFIWHNESIGTGDKWKSWPELMHKTLTLFEPA